MTRRYGVYLSDIRRASNNSQGVVNYALALVSCLPRLLETDEKLVVFSSSEILAECEFSNDVEIWETPSIKGPVERVLTDQWFSTRRAAKAEVNLLHFPKGLIPYRPWRGVPVVATIHDDIPVQYAQGRWDSQGEAVQHKYVAHQVIHAAKYADRVITVSDFSRRQLEIHTRGRGRSAPTVISNGCMLPIKPYVPIAQRRGEALIFGSRFPHKRTAEGIEFFRRFKASVQSPLTLNLIGHLPTEAADMVNVHEKGPLSSEEVAEAVATCRVLIFNSEYEGFGLPPLEAWAQGTPAIYPAIEPLLETLGPGHGCFAPRDRDSFRLALEQVLAMTDEELIKRSLHLRKCFSMERTSSGVLEVFRSLGG